MQSCRRQWGDFCLTVIFYNTEGERGIVVCVWGALTSGKTRRKQGDGGCIHSCFAHELWHFWQRYPLFSDPTLIAPAHSFRLAQSPLEISHSLSRNEALPCLAWGSATITYLEFTSLVYYGFTEPTTCHLRYYVVWIYIICKDMKINC